MWISKRKWVELTDRLDDLEYITKDIDRFIKEKANTYTIQNPKQPSWRYHRVSIDQVIDRILEKLGLESKIAPATQEGFYLAKKNNSKILIQNLT